MFHNLTATREHGGLVVFLEEDHYVAQDFLHVLQQMQEERLTRFPAVDILSLGTYLRKTAAKTLKTSGKQVTNIAKFPFSGFHQTSESN